MLSSNDFGVPSTATITPPSGARLRFQNDPTKTTAADDETRAIVMNATSQVHKDRNFLLIGRQAATCDIRITHKSLSRQHAVLYYENEKESELLLIIQDLKTKSGTWVNQERLAPNTPTVLKEGNIVQFGKAQPSFVVEYEKTPIKEESHGGGVGESSTFMKKQEEHKEEINGEESTPTNNNTDGEKSVSATSKPEIPKEPLTGRAARQAEIAAMMASLEEAPTYTKYQPTQQEQKEESERVQQLRQQQAATKEALHPMIEKHKLPFPETSPCSQSVSAESSVISSIAMDPSGTRFAMAHMDSSMQLYDFAGWSSSSSEATAFSNVLVNDDNHAITSVTYSPNGDRFVVATHSAQPKVFDKEGEEVLQWVRGDVYVTDPAKTIGHTAAVVAVGWHAVDKSIVFSASQDGSLRVWNVDTGKLAFGMLKCQDVILLKNPQTGRRTAPTCMIMMGPSSVWLGTECGSIQRYQYPFVSKLRPQQSTMVPEAAAAEDESSSSKSRNKLANTTKEHAIRCIAVSGDGTKVAARTQKAIHVYTNSSLYRLALSSSPLLSIPLQDDDMVETESDNSTPTMAFSPNNKTLCIGVTRVQTDNNKKYYETRLQLYSIPKESTETKIKKKPIYSMPLVELQYPLVGLLWHPKLNQILVATTKEFQVCYSMDYSKKGMLLNLRQRTSSSKRKRTSGEDALQELYTSRAPPPGTAIREEEIIAPNALPLFGGQTNRKKKLKERQEEQHEQDMARHKPQPPAKGVYNTNNTMFAQMVMDNQTANLKQIAGMDPREALAQYSEGKSYIGTAYEGNKERILADKTVEEEEDAMK